MSMNVIKTEIPEVLIIEPQIFSDERGYFFESFNQKLFDDVVNRHVEFVQDNHSRSSKGVLRVLHYQLPPFAQAKLVRCIVGEVFDVAVDIRTMSPTFGHWVGVRLSAENKRQLWIPEGFAHGFLTLSENAEFAYKTTNFYCKEAEAGIIWNDPQINIKWPENNMEFILSTKDVILPCLTDARHF